MFDPTIFDNLKVVLEGALYDKDFDGVLQITNRMDRMELSSMSRSFGMEFTAKPAGAAKGRVRLTASVADLAAELLAETDKQPGCGLQLTFMHPIREMEADCAWTEELIRDIWGDGVEAAQSVRMTYGSQPVKLTNHLTVRFTRKLDERQIDDIPSLLDHVVLSLQRLDERFAGH
ncbi:hypothetical protein [Paenibacillus piri]|uniref:Uncharacterized protein n=1 Tax=Paenibacillus piri TaxID=2547395 RepID=A0A4R5KVS6_9BACL|nr:hypothetical protein [Paenibacillus piri]TDF99602.1 hypothetical protein E1757_07150 [Paenibacillus piri]